MLRAAALIHAQIRFIGIKSAWRFPRKMFQISGFFERAIETCIGRDRLVFSFLYVRVCACMCVYVCVCLAVCVRLVGLCLCLRLSLRLLLCVFIPVHLCLFRMCLCAKSLCMESTPTFTYVVDLCTFALRAQSDLKGHADAGRSKGLTWWRW